MKNLFVICGLLLLARTASAQTSGGGQLTNPVVMVIVLGALGLAHFVVIMLTSFVKISVVLSILRNALGTQQVPPNQIITGLAFILTIFIMTPVAREMYQAAGAIGSSPSIFSEGSIRNLFDAAGKGKEPLRQFLSRHSHATDRVLFMELAARLDRRPALPASQEPATAPQVGQQPATPPPVAAGVAQAAQAPQAPPAPSEPKQPSRQLDKNDFQILIPAFVTSELKEAFQIGFLVFVPFVIIDMVVANVLLAMGMSMLSPSVISLPFKLLLFVLVDGWYLIVRGMVLSYV